MTHQELIQKDFQAKGEVIDAERGYLRSQIALLEAQLKQNAVKGLELERQWASYVESVNKQQAQQAEQNGAQIASETATGKPKKATAKA